YVGEVLLTWDHEEQKLIHKEAYTTNITHLPKDAQTENLVAELQYDADQVLNDKITYTDNRIEVDWYTETPIMKKFTEKLRQWTNADCAMLNAGLLLDSCQSGNITFKDVHRICTHPINPCIVSLNGYELQEVVRASLTDQLINLQLKGFGFRGVVIGRMVFANLEVMTEYHNNGKEYVKQVLFEGRPLETNRLYQVVTADTFTFGRLLPEVAKSEKKTLFLPEFIREILVETLKEYNS